MRRHDAQAGRPYPHSRRRVMRWRACARSVCAAVLFQSWLVGRPRQSGSHGVRGLAWCVVSENWGVGQTDDMGIGVSIFLLALGAIMTFAVDWTVGWLDLNAVGWVLMAAGVVGLVLFFYFWNRRRAPAA